MKYLKKNVVSAHLKFKQLFGCVEKTVFWEDFIWFLFLTEFAVVKFSFFWCLRMHLAEQDQCLVETCTNNMCEGKHSVSVWSSLDSIQLSETMQRPVSCNQCKNKTTMYFIPSQQKLLPSSCFAEPSTTLISNGFLTIHLEREGTKPVKSYKF